MKRVIVFLFILAGCATSSGRHPAQNSTVDVEIFARQIAAILRPYTAALDRDLWAFRYENSEEFKPRTQVDLQNRIGKWADRFFDPDIINGADTGPGVYVSTDPVATAIFGETKPRLYAIQIKQGTRMLIGDQFAIPDDVSQSLKKVSLELGCGRTSTDMNDIGHAVGFFRMNEVRECRMAMIAAIRSLNVLALSYGFNSVPMKDCRPTGTAISIIDHGAISLDKINGYSSDGNIEGQPNLAPFISKLFNETKDDFYAQTSLDDMDTWKRFRHAYGFFDKAGEVDLEAYKKWKSEHILKCGPAWSIETPNPRARAMMQARQNADPQVAEMLIRMSLLYRDRFSRALLFPRPAASEFNILQLRLIKKNQSAPLDTDNLIRYGTAQVPVWTNDPKADKSRYLNLLNKCLSLYEDESKDFAQIVRGECGVDEETGR